jgi:hypothetical protein
MSVCRPEATIHYSGRIGEFFGNCGGRSARFQLDQPGDSIRLRHSLEFGCTASYGGFAHFGVLGLAGASFAGFYCPNHPQIKSVSELDRGELISRRPFLARESGVIAILGSCGGQFDSEDVGFIGFKFNNGSGDQYGWVRIKMGTNFPIDNDFWLVDYAYADPGEPIRAGQTSSNDVVPIEGSLGGLALGAAGLLAWRKGRPQAARQLALCYYLASANSPRTNSGQWFVRPFVLLGLWTDGRPVSNSLSSSTG